MATNTFRTSANEAPKPKRFSLNKLEIYTKIESWIAEKIQFGNEIPTDMLKNIFWLSFLALIYIFLQYQYEGLLKKIAKARTEMEESRAAYISQKSRYMYASKQSEIAKKLSAEGLEENITPPVKIVVKE